MLNHYVVEVSEHFDTDHKAVSVNIGLGGLLDVDKQRSLEGASVANAAMFLEAFVVANRLSDLDAMWDVICKVVIFSANKVLKKRWFRGFDNIFTKEFSRFHKLELLVSKLVKASHLVFSNIFALLLDTWVGLDPKDASMTSSLFLFGSDFDFIHIVLAKAKKSYCSAKLLESKYAEESQIKQAIERKIESFEFDKGHTIKSSLIFAIGSVVEDALKKNRKLWLVLQDMHKVYDSVGWKHLERSLIRIKICDKFIRFFGSIHNGCYNRVMMDFGLSDGYCVHDSLD
ncbi:hypothetical protein G9A89_021556 [Geosiphon pyriformis]|nr:hypothetical protein G9A89_021556 [Geosiphon pyriformis]